MQRKEFDKEQIDKLRSEQKMNWTSICKLFSCDMGTLRKWKKRTNYIDPLTGNKAIDKDISDRFDRGEMTKLRKKGWSWHEISSYKRVTFDTIKTWRKQVQFVEPVRKEKNTRRALDETTKNKVVKDFKNGMPKVEIAEKYNLTPNTVHQACKKEKNVYEQLKLSDWGKVGALKKAGWSNLDIADDIGIELIAVLFILQCLDKFKGSTRNCKIKGMKIAKKFDN